MSVQDVADRVVEALSRAESLFATPADTASRMTAAVEDASEASRAMAHTPTNSVARIGPPRRARRDRSADKSGLGEEAQRPAVCG
jgi:hypothetical protein